MTDFDSPREGTGTMEWAEVTENIQMGCSHQCLYCYAAHRANQFGKRKRDDWGREVLTKRAEIKTYPMREGVIMIPSSHDITPFNIDAFLRVTMLMLKAKNNLLIVSKPHLECVEKMCKAYREHKDQILFRFTIGTMDEETSKFWEPGAPPPSERLSSLKAAKDAGYKTSVSAEPLLGGFATAEGIAWATDPYITDTIWIGKMNKARLRVDMTVPEYRKAVLQIEDKQSDDEMMDLYTIMKGNPKIRWKDSIKAVVERRS